MAQTNSGAKKPSIFARFGKYLKDVRTELRRVVWPTRAEVINSSIVVIITLVFFVLFTLVIDSISSFVFLDVLAGIGR
ncbi:MAG: preprotein translocase subunit SecE [Aeromicrobium sp.]|jgi:preprotein translocase subunit SecE|nr:preprotein translocase subunit SecE [Aeromicrobium sp.]